MISVCTTTTATDDFQFVVDKAIKATGQTQNFCNYDGNIVCYSVAYDNNVPVWCSVAQHRNFYKPGVVGLFRKLYSEISVPAKETNQYSELALHQQWKHCIAAGYTTGFFSTQKDVRKFFAHQTKRWERITNATWYFDSKKYRVCNGDESCNQYVAWCNATYCPFDLVV